MLDWTVLVVTKYQRRRGVEAFRYYKTPTRGYYAILCGLWRLDIYRREDGENVQFLSGREGLTLDEMETIIKTEALSEEVDKARV